MLRNVCVFAVLCLVPALASAQTARGPFELELGGGATNFASFHNNVKLGPVYGSGNVDLGFFVTDMLELGVRQYFMYTDVNGANWQGSTALAVDLNIPLGEEGQIVPFIGGNIGYTYGEGVPGGLWEAAPEAGLKVFLNATTFIYGSVEYQFYFNKSGNNFASGEFLYGLGLGVRF